VIYGKLSSRTKAPAANAAGYSFRGCHSASSSSRAKLLLWRQRRAHSVIGRNDTVSTQFAGRLSLIAFATAAVRGLWFQADFLGTIQTALVSLGVFYVLGLVIGEAARRIVEENAKADLVERFGSVASAGTGTSQA
jgi:hypothetical protein